MAHTLLMDIDGVLLKWTKPFSKHMEAELNLPADSILEFFKGEFIDCTTGKCDLKEVLPPYLDRWGWNKGIDPFLDYWFGKDVLVDTALLEDIQKLRQKGIRAYLASDQEKHRAEFLQQKLGMDKFDGGFFSYDLGVRKDNPQFFTKLLEQLDHQPDQVIYFDDDPEKVASAKSAGINAHLYIDRDSFQNALEDYGFDK